MPQISRKFPGKPFIVLPPGPKIQVMNMLFWQGLHFSRCWGFNLDMGRVWWLPAFLVAHNAQNLNDFELFPPEIAIFRSVAVASLGSELFFALRS